MICTAVFLSVPLMFFAQVGSCNEVPTALDQLERSVPQELKPAEAPLPEMSAAKAFKELKLTFSQKPAHLQV